MNPLDITCPARRTNIGAGFEKELPFERTHKAG
jgi:hypothetical protein